MKDSILPLPEHREHDAAEGLEIGYGFSLKDLHIRITGIQYDPRWGTLNARLRVADRDTGKLITLHAGGRMPTSAEMEQYGGVAEELFAESLREALFNIMTHEVDELIRHDGKRYFERFAERNHGRPSEKTT